MSGNQPQDPPETHLSSWEDANPYKPPSAVLMLPGNHRPPFKGMAFGHRLLLLPLWFLLATIPTMLLIIMLNPLAGQDFKAGDGTMALPSIIVAAVPASILIYRGLMRPFQLERHALSLWALAGVPLVTVAFIAFLAVVTSVYLALSGHPVF